MLKFINVFFISKLDIVEPSEIVCFIIASILIDEVIKALKVLLIND